MKIAANALVTIEVSLYDAQGQLIEASDGPMTYLHGHADIFPRIEEALTGKVAGDKLSITLEPEDAFGDYDAELMHLVPLGKLGENPVVGLRFEGLPGQVPDGRTYLVTEIAEGVAVLDANHPLAGLTLRFDIEVKGVEEPAAEDLAGGEDSLVPDFLEVVEPQDLHAGDAKHKH